MKGSGLSKQTGSRLAQEAGSMPGSTGDNNHGMQAKEGSKQTTGTGAGSARGTWTTAGAAAGAGAGAAASAGCDAATVGACVAANPEIVLTTSALGAALGKKIDDDLAKVHGNSAESMQGTDVYYLRDRDTDEIAKIGITSRGESRYTQSFYEAENVRYEVQAEYTLRYAAMLDENVRLTFYQFDHGELPRLNKVTR